MKPTLKIAITNTPDGIPVRNELKTQAGTLRPGETLEVPEGQAQYFIRQGLAHEVQAAPPPVAESDPPKRKRGRPRKVRHPESLPPFLAE